MNTTNTPSPIPFTQTEEAFLLNCVGEVMKVWATKSGHANMNIIVENGMVDLKLNFKLGPPGDAHLPPQSVHLQTPPRYKTPARKAKDRARAASHQQALLATSAAPAVHQQHGSPLATAQHEAESVSLSQADPALPFHQADPAFPLHQAEPADRHRAAPALPSLSFQAVPASLQTIPTAAATAALQQNAVPAPFKQNDDPDTPHQQAAPAHTCDKTTQTTSTSDPPLAVPSPSPPAVSEDEKEMARITRRVISQANYINDSMSYGKIGYSDYYYDIQADFYKTIKSNPKDFVDDEPKIRECLLKTARSYKVRI